MRTYVARQPIFDTSTNVFGYELLYRNSTQNIFDTTINEDLATQQVISDVITTFGTDTLLSGKRAFINFTRTLLLSSLYTVLSPADFIIEILESVPADDEVLNRMKHLRELGFVLALDDYIGLPESDAILDLVDIVKVDFLQTNTAKQYEISKNLRKRNLLLLAEKIETSQDFERAKKIGFTLFQGYFFSKPIIFSKAILRTPTSTYLRTLNELVKDDIDFTKITSIIRSDVTLTYRLLRHINTMQFNHHYPINNVRLAIVQLGVHCTYRWLMLILIHDMAHDCNNEYCRIALLRAIFCDRLCALMQLPFYQDEAYIVGMFSIIDSLMGKDFADMLNDISISPKVKQALLCHENILSNILDFVISYNHGEWEKVNHFIALYGLLSDDVVNAYRYSVQDADKNFNSF